MPKSSQDDCILREPRHLPEPTAEDLALEREYESDPESDYDFEAIAKKMAQLKELNLSTSTPANITRAGRSSNLLYRYTKYSII